MLDEPDRSSVTDALMEMSSEALLALTPEGEVLCWNEGAGSVFGLAPADAIGKRIQVLFDGASGPFLSAIETASREGSSSFRWSSALASARQRSVNVTLRRIEAHGHLPFIAVRGTEAPAVLRLDTEEHSWRAELEAQNRRIEEANRLKSEFVANMSHELRTPLNSVIGFAELMVTGKVGGMADNHKEYLGDILASSKHLLQLINDVLDLAKVESGKIEIRPEALNVSKIVGEVRDILRGLAGERRTKIDLELSLCPQAVMLDGPKLKQVLYNYLSNAIKFTPDGGLVTVSVTPEGDDQMKIVVQDTGIGVKHEDLHRLFVEFQQLDAGIGKRYGGTGLGLAVTKRIVEAQGGSVGVQSAIGRGTSFWAILPLVGQASLPLVGQATSVEAADAH